MPRTLVVAITLLAAAGCAYQLPTVPDVATPPLAAAAPGPSTARFEVTARIDASGRSATLQLQAWDERGAKMPVDATCAASPSGVVYPQRIGALASGQGQLVEANPTTIVVTCRQAGFDRPAVTWVDLSAWSVRFDSFNASLTPSHVDDLSPGWGTSATVRFTALSSTVPASRRVVSWGDGQSEVVPGHIPTTEHAYTTRHHYGRSGTFEVRARVEWGNGFAAETAVFLTRTCRPDPAPYGFCQSTWREVTP